jgi:sugar phosphate isomerase/epimerase
MEKLGIRNLMLAPAVRYARSEAEFLRMRELLIRAFLETVEHVRGSGISVMIENQSIPTRADSRAEDIKIILDSVPGLGYVLDTGNFFCIREDVKAAYALLKGRVTRVHMKDWEIDKYGSFLRENLPRFDGVAIGDGLIPNKEMIEMLYADNYQGKIVLEVNSGRIDLPMLERSAKFLRENVPQ